MTKPGQTLELSLSDSIKSRSFGNVKLYGGCGNRLHWRFTVLLGMFVLSGCAIGVTHQHDAVVPGIRAIAGSEFVQGVQDRSVYALSRDKTETFVGFRQSFSAIRST